MNPKNVRSTVATATDFKLMKVTARVVFLTNARAAEVIQSQLNSFLAQHIPGGFYRAEIKKEEIDL